ncbi:MAG: ATP-dependent DNA helicase [Defluviitaleaceae bacterium]|nr:ATP-dependent DNA helicase [Defluviitaleaceae bacterium]
MKISVHKIVDLILRSGDIDTRFNDASAMHKGSAAHRKIQREAGEGYIKEVPLKRETEIAGIPVTVQGRADGIITKDGEITIDEIKATTLPLDYIFRQHTQHLGQAKCYAHMYAQTLSDPPEYITVQVTYFQLESEEIRRHSWRFTIAELDAFFHDLLHRYGIWLRFELDWKEKRDASIKTAAFPFETYRKGQREFAVAAYRTVLARKKLYAAAPTGIGKTLSALFPTIKAMGEGHAEKIFYLTAKTVTRAVAQDAVRLMADKGLRFKALTLRSKDRICPNGERNCTPDRCANALGHYNRVNDALWDLINAHDLVTPDIISQFAKKFIVCPHEFALDASLWSDLVIGDYNHVFDPGAYLRRFFNRENEERAYVFLIDEAHNLADRVRDMYTASLSKNILSRIRKKLRGRDALTSDVRRELKQIDAYLKDMREENTQNHAVREQDMVLKALFTTLRLAMGEWLATGKNNANLSGTDDDTGNIYGSLLDLYFELDMFLGVSELYDAHFTTLVEVADNDVVLTLFCLDPSAIITERLAYGVSAILFSATLTPLRYYREMLGGNEDDPIISLPSPFDPAKQRITIHAGISTKYIDRERSYEPIADAIYAAVSERKGNYFVFFPSYAYLNEVYLKFYAKYPDVQTLVQTSNMAEDDREDFLDQFDETNEETLVGFTVLGGIFSEGIDLKGDRLIGSIIVSVGIPMISLRTDQIRDYFNDRNGQGYDYAYVYPGMNKVLQAAGRVIRTETDEGIVLLIDNRFATKKYRDMFPVHWKNVKVIR